MCRLSPCVIRIKNEIRLFDPAVKEKKMVICQAVGAIKRYHVFKALVVKGQGINDGFCQDQGLGSSGSLAVHQAVSFARQVQMFDVAVFVNVPAIRVDHGLRVIMQREHHTVGERTLPFAFKIPIFFKDAIT